MSWQERGCGRFITEGSLKLEVVLHAKDVYSTASGMPSLSQVLVRRLQQGSHPAFMPVEA